MQSLWMLAASFLFACMGVCVKLAAETHSAVEITFYRSFISLILMFGLVRLQGVALATPHWRWQITRGLVGFIALFSYFYAITLLPLATAVTLNYMSSVWMALFLMVSAVVLGSARVDARLVGTVLAGFIGVTLVLQPSVEQDQWLGALSGLLSGVLSAVAYLQVTALGRAGEPDYRVVFYFSLGGTVAGLLLAGLSGGLHAHTWSGAGLLLATGLLATLAQMLMTRAYAIGRALANASLQYLGIVYSFVYGVLIFGESVTGSAILGMVMIVLAGITATLLRAPSRSTPPPTDP